ncbi:PREDICTED: mammaglobin-B-like isoform X1 [Myotis davidii]|uniref:mammaglobin-B-like isoform X1 n=1 Tax=Myotis davidii TaxID=225400 RepID=UPI000767BD34|nr:PREDICTED: mammaglobin-B-like isoform X1 [Myotis davidii]
MKLVVVLMLSALPLSCYAGSGCQRLEDMIDNTIDPSVTEDQYIEGLDGFIPGDDTEQYLREFKQCFLGRSSRTLSTFSEIMVMAVSSHLPLKHWPGTRGPSVCY